MMRTRLPIILLTMLLAATLHGQNYTMNGNPVTDCNGTFYDPGGETGNYGDNQSLTTTICSDGSSGTHIRLSFSGADIAPGDALCFYDGVNLAAPLLSCHTDYAAGQPFLLQATAVNASGCITVAFNSNSSGNGTGWSAAISCVPSCQTILADLVSTNPVAAPVDTGWIDICPGERVFFNGTGSYPQNNFAYAQSDLTTTFEWNFGDGGIAYGPNTSHRFDAPGGYYVQLFLTDEQGCRNTNLINQRVRVAPRPNFQAVGALDQTICAGDTIQLSATTTGMGDETLVVTANSASFAVEGSRSDSLALPDGTGIPYETTIFFTEFSPGQVLTSANDLENICVNIEHSWARDLEITLTCPNGQSIILHDHPGNFGGQIFLGEPNDNDNVFPIPGLGYDYCWVNNAPNGTWIEYANALPGGSGTLPTGEYSTFDPIADLIGCPLNGEWTITVTDLWGFDNGYIFNWSLKFLDQLYPNIETFSPGITTWGWNNHPSIYFSTADSIAASPQNAGAAGYTFSVTDGFGCVWDTLLTIAVLPPTHPDCFSCGAFAPILPDTTICAGNSVPLNGTALAPPLQEVRFESYPEYRLGNGNHPHANPYFSPVAISSLGYPFITNPLQQITSVCMDIETDYCSDLNIFLQSPGGQLLELSSGNGGSGDNFKITCFTPTATQTIIGQPAPFNGTFRPEGNWNAFLGAAVNGNWSLRVSDGFAPNQYGTIKWWSIGFNVNNNVTYSWSNPPGLSCTNCATPIATPGQSTAYTISTSDAFGCVKNDTVQITVLNTLAGPANLSVFSQGGSDMTWQWDAVSGAIGYEVSVNGGSWEPANGQLMHTISGLTLGQNVTIEVRALSAGCNALSTQNSSLFGNCTLVASLDVVSPSLCAGDSTGSALITVMGGDMPILYQINDWPGALPSGNLQQMFPAGNHSVIVRDVAGCADTLNFNIAGPTPIDISVNALDVSCNGLNTGAASATAVGGVGPYGFEWETCSGVSVQSGGSATNLVAGCYNLVTTDGNGCVVTREVTISEPAALNLVTTQTPVSCFGGNNGVATVTVTGGTAPISYLWDNGQTSDIATGYTAGFHSVSISDANGCSASAFAQVTQPAQLLVSDAQTQPVSCFGGTNGAATVTLSGGTTPYQFVWDNGQTTQTAQNIPAGPHAVTITDVNGCMAQVVLTVSEPFALLATFSNVEDEPCAGNCQGQATIAPSGGIAPYNYSWSSPLITPGVQTATGLCAGTYTVTISDANGCTHVQTTPIAGAIPIQVQFTPTLPTCSGLSDGAATAQASGGVSPYQYNWQNGNNTPNLQQIPCGNHILTITDALGCQFTDTIILDCPIAVTVQNTNIVAAQCFGSLNGSATVQAQGGVAPYTYLWSDATGQSTAQANNLAAGTYTVTVSDGNNCQSTASVTIPEPTLLAGNISPVNIICFNGTTGSATASANGGVAPYSFLWSQGSAAAQITNLAANTYTVTITDANFCTTTTSITLTQPAQPMQVTATQTLAACSDQSNGQAVASATSNAGGPYTFAWSNGQQTALSSMLSAGSYVVTATDQAGCTGTQMVQVLELEPIVVNVAFVPPSCFGKADGLAAVNLISGGIGMGDTSLYQYNWSIPGVPDAAQIGGLRGDLTYTITVSDLQGCSGTFSFVVSQPPAIVLNTQAEDVNCFGGNDGLAVVTGLSNANLPVSYAWSNGGTGSQVSSLVTGTYTVTVTDTKGCTAMKSFVIEQPPTLDLSFTQEPLLCATEQTAIIEATIQGGMATYNYAWSNGSTTASINQLGAGVYVLTVTDQNGCTVTGSQTIVLPDSLRLALQMTPPECFGERNGRIKLLVSGGQIPYRYSLNGGEFGGSSTFIALTAGIYTLQVRDANGCITSLIDTLDQPPAIIVQLPADTTLVLGDSLLLSSTITQAVGNVTYAWSSTYVDSLTCVDVLFCDEIWVKPAISNIYQLMVTDENGCVGKASVAVKIEKPRGVYVPTAFSPNGDFTNDLLVVHGLSKQVRNILTFRIFDRWGELIYEDKNFTVNQLDHGWDGQFRGKPVDPGVFVWVLEAEYIDGHRDILKGNVTLIR